MSPSQILASASNPIDGFLSVPAPVSTPTVDPVSVFSSALYIYVGIVNNVTENISTCNPTRVVVV